jgi:hypothetical protein
VFRLRVRVGALPELRARVLPLLRARGVAGFRVTDGERDWGHDDYPPDSADANHAAADARPANAAAPFC